jgi:hypothetical protein
MDEEINNHPRDEERKRLNGNHRIFYSHHKIAGRGPAIPILHLQRRYEPVT